MRDDPQIFPDPDDLERANQEERVTQERFTRYDALFLGSCRVQPPMQESHFLSLIDVIQGGFDR